MLSIDIYCRSRRRDRETIYAFINTYVDRDEYHDVKFTLRLGPLGEAPGPDTENYWDDEIVQVVGFEGLVRRALDHPPRSFTVYPESRSAQINRAIIRFTREEQVVFGLSVESGRAAAADDLLASMIQQFGAHRGAILLETPLPDRDQGFDNVERGCRPFRLWAPH